MSSGRRRRLRGYVWFIRLYGVRRLWRYERARRSGLTIDYSRIYTPAELSKLEASGFAPWEDIPR